MKINGRLIKIALISFVASVVIVGGIYYTMASALAPEPTVKAYTYTKNLDKGMILTQLDIKETIIPKSLYSKDMEQDISDIVDKKLIVDVTEGEFIYINKLTDRGRIEQDYDDLYIIGIDVTNISNCLGTQLKVGDIYYIMSSNEEDITDNAPGETKTYEKISNNPENITDDEIKNEANPPIEVVVVALVDNSGNEVYGNKQSPIKTINIGVKAYEEMEKILQCEKADKLEIVRFPKE